MNEGGRRVGRVVASVGYVVEAVPIAALVYGWGAS